MISIDMSLSPDQKLRIEGLNALDLPLLQNKVQDKAIETNLRLNKLGYPSKLIRAGLIRLRRRRVWPLVNLEAPHFIDMTNFYMRRPTVFGRFLPLRKLPIWKLPKEDLITIYAALLCTEQLAVTL